MGHSLNRTNFRINQNLVIDDNTFNPGYILVSDEKGNASWKNPSEFIDQKEPLDRFIGELYGGGIVVAVWREQRDAVYEKVLIASVRDYGEQPSVGAATNFSWTWGSGAFIGPSSSYHSYGASNSIANVAEELFQGNPLPPAASKSLNYVNEDLGGLGIYRDWYLPSTFEINCLANNAAIVNRVIAQYAADKSIRLYDQGSPGSILPSSMSLFCGAKSGTRASGGAYWTSTEIDGLYAYALNMDTFRLESTYKLNAKNVRPFRQETKRWNGSEWIILEENNRRKTGKVLIVYDQQYYNFIPKMIANITSTETSLGNTTTVNVGYSNLPSDLSQYDHIWDIGLEDNASQSLLVPTGVAAKYTTYLQQGGGLFILGENSSFGVRNGDLASFISGIGGGTVQHSGFEDRNVTVDSEFLLANNQSSLVLPDSGRFASIGTGTPITRNSYGQVGSAVVWKTGSLSLAPKGAIVVVLDINFISNYYAPGSSFNGSLTYAKEFVDNISQILNKK